MIEINKDETLLNLEETKIIINNSTLDLTYLKEVKELTINIMENGKLKLGILDLTKNNSQITINLIGENSEAEVNYRTFTESDKEITIKTNHLNKNTKSNITSFGVIKNSLLTMNIISHIEKGNKKSEAYQSSRAIALDNAAKANLNPILEIKEYDVKGGHGAVFSKITDEEIYYLQSRGFKKEDAINLIISAILASNINYDASNIIKERLK